VALGANDVEAAGQSLFAALRGVGLFTGVQHALPVRLDLGPDRRRAGLLAGLVGSVPRTLGERISTVAAELDGRCRGRPCWWRS
jgi:hypothetical protein